VNFYDDIVHVLRNTKKRRQQQTVKQPLNSQNKVHFAYGKHTFPQLPNESLLVADDGLMSMIWCKHGFQQLKSYFDGKFVRV